MEVSGSSTDEAEQSDDDETAPADDDDSGPETTTGDGDQGNPPSDPDVTSTTGEDAAESGDGEATVESVLQCVSGTMLIPDDGQWLDVELPVESTEGTVSVAAGVRAQHMDVSQLELSLVGPQGMTVPLLDHPQCPGGNIDAIFDDDAPAEGPCSPVATSAIAGMLMPLEPMSPLLDAPLEGVWTLRVRDDAPDVSGQVDQFCIILQVAVP